MRVELNRSALEELLRSPAGPVVREVTKYTRMTENRAKTKVGVDTGRLRSSITGTVTAEGTRIVGRVGSGVVYAAYHHQGTGVYGPKGRPIRPKNGPFLVFTPKGAKRPVFARQVSGSKPNPYLVDALRETVPWKILNQQ